MPINISYSNRVESNLTDNIVLFVNEKFNTNNLKNYVNNNELSYVNDLLKNSDLKKNILIFEINSKKKIILISIKNNLKSIDIENLGAEFYDQIKIVKSREYYVNSDSVVGKNENFIGHFLHGFKLKSYKFQKYKTKKEKEDIILNIIGKKNKPSSQVQLNFKALEEGNFYARDLVSEPGNILHPDEYAKRLSSLKKDGLKIKVYDKKELKKLGMNALLGVGMGSVRGSYLVTIGGMVRKILNL